MRISIENSEHNQKIISRFNVPVSHGSIDFDRKQGNLWRLTKGNHEIRYSEEYGVLTVFIRISQNGLRVGDLVHGNVTDMVMRITDIAYPFGQFDQEWATCTGPIGSYGFDVNDLSLIPQEG